MRLLTTIALLACACGPLGATSVIADAEIAVARAHAASGDTQAPWEMASADLHLQKAKEEQGQARYGAAMDLAKKAQGFAGAFLSARINAVSIRDTSSDIASIRSICASHLGSIRRNNNNCVSISRRDPPAIATNRV